MFSTALRVYISGFSSFKFSRSSVWHWFLNCINYVCLTIPQMAKNKGLTPKRKKIDRNPRVKHREKFRRAKIRRKGQVCIQHVLLHRWARISGIVWRLLKRMCWIVTHISAMCFKIAAYRFARSERFVTKRRDTAESCLVFVLVSRRVSNSSNRVQNMLPSVAVRLNQYQWTVILNVYYWKTLQERKYCHCFKTWNCFSDY